MGNIIHEAERTCQLPVALSVGVHDRYHNGFLHFIIITTALLYAGRQHFACIQQVTVIVCPEVIGLHFHVYQLMAVCLCLYRIKPSPRRTRGCLLFYGQSPCSSQTCQTRKRSAICVLFYLRFLFLNGPTSGILNCSPSWSSSN